MQRHQLTIASIRGAQGTASTGDYGIMADEQEHTNDELEELPFWKAALAFIGGFIVGSIIGA